MGAVMIILAQDAGINHKIEAMQPHDLGDKTIVLLEKQGPLAILSLNRPEVRNALSQALRNMLYERLLELRNAEDIGAIILTGKGKAFCAGLDLEELKGIRERSSTENLADSQAFADLLDLIYHYPKPVIAALNGHAIAGGAGIASVCDMIIMSEEPALAIPKRALVLWPLWLPFISSAS
ncbi:MAG: enoyl-CoA hydratase/isomerase family protein [Deinococcales bacterium]